MFPQFHNKENHLIVLLNLLFSVWLTNCNDNVVNNTGIQCVVSERVALLHFKQGINIDNCGLLDSWGDGLDCCQWYGTLCSNHSGHVIGLRLPGIQDPTNNNSKACLQGTLSESLLELKHLKYLDLSFNNFRGQIPKFIGSLDALEHLNLSNARFFGVVPQEIGNLPRLSSLDLNCRHDDSYMSVESLDWLSHLRLLQQLDLSGIDLRVATTTWIPIVNNLPFLQVLRLDECHLSLELQSSLPYTIKSSALNVISLALNNLSDTSIFEWLLKLKTVGNNLVHLNLSSNQMFGNNIQGNGHAVKILGSLCNLQTLDLSDTSLKYDFSNFVQSFSACSHTSLMSLYLRSNQIWGSIQSNINILSSLRKLNIGVNQLNGTISQALGGLSMLESLDLYSNSLKGVVTGEHLANLSKLSELILGDDTELMVNISADWNPPFQLDRLILYSCKIGPHFPTWLSTQKHLTTIYLYNTSISGKIPSSFFKSLSSNLKYLNMSYNMMHGILPNVSVTFDHPPLIDLSSNNFYGAIPPSFRNVSTLNLNNNHLSQGIVPFLCPQNKVPLVALDLSNNLFSGKLSDCWGYFDKLVDLRLDNNKLWGNFPTSIGMLDQLSFLYLNNNNISGELPISLVNCTSLVALNLSHNSLTGSIPSAFGYSFQNLAFVYLNNNNISGELPISLVNCTSLVALDLSHNSLTGSIPSAFGFSFPNLGILLLQSNNFSGALPLGLCKLSQVQLLDLSSNHIHGTIPDCIGNLKAMANPDSVYQFTSIAQTHSSFKETYDNALIMWEKKELNLKGHTDVLVRIKVIDFSDNKLEGHIPDGISRLIGLMAINLSRNHFSGSITSQIGQLTTLEVLDLSHNYLSGRIPTSLATIDYLALMDLSYNNLYGKIPIGSQLQTFDVSTYMGNLGLCGAPLPKCEGDEAAPTPQNGDNATHHDEHLLDNFKLGLYISVVLGFITGFWGVCGTLVIKRSWRHAFFRFYDHTKDRIYVVIAVHIARVWRRS